MKGDGRDGKGARREERGGEGSGWKRKGCVMAVGGWTPLVIFFDKMKVALKRAGCCVVAFGGSVFRNFF